MKEQLLELSRVCRETTGASCNLVILKNGKFKIEFPQVKLKSTFEPNSCPEVVIQGAIDYIMTKRELLLPTTPRDGMNPESKYTIKKQF